MSMYNPIANAVQHDFCILGSNISPGICQVQGLSKKQKWDVKDGQGTKGAKITFVGDVLAKFKIKFTLWEEYHFDLWESQIVPVLQKSLDPPHPALDIWHPDCVEKGIKSVVVEDISQFVEAGDGFDITITFIEYREPKPDFGTPKGSAATVNGPVETKEDKASKNLQDKKARNTFKKDLIAQRKARRQK